MRKIALSILLFVSITCFCLLAPWVYNAVYSLTVEPCAGPMSIPSVTIGRYYVIIGEEQIYPGQKYEYQPGDGGFIIRMSLVSINNQGATFVASYHDLYEGDFTCGSFYPKVPEIGNPKELQ